MPFDDETKTKVLLWCDRHCCLCKKACGVNIEVHHIIPESEEGTNDIDNAIPLCFDCHGVVEHYNPKHPIGNKFKEKEIKARRDQIYDEFTRRLVPPILYRIYEHPKPFPTVGFELSHLGDSLPVRIRILVECVKENGETIKMSDHYGGERLWRLNPRFTISGSHFNLPQEYIENNDEIKVRISVSIIDKYKREHPYLPSEYKYSKEDENWFLEP